MTRPTYTQFTVAGHPAYAHALTPGEAVRYARERSLTTDDLRILSEDAREAVMRCGVRFVMRCGPVFAGRRR